MCRQQGDCSLSILEDNRGCVGSRETVLYPYWRSIEDVKAVGRLSSVPIGGQQRMCRKKGDCPQSLLEDNRRFVGSRQTVLCSYWGTLDAVLAVGKLSSVPTGGQQRMCRQQGDCPQSLLEDNRGCVGSRETVFCPYLFAYDQSITGGKFRKPIQGMDQGNWILRDKYFFSECLGRGI